MFDLLGSADRPDDQPVDALASADVLAALVAAERLRARLDARTAQLLARFDAECLYELDGAASARSWLKHHVGVTASTAAGRLKMARQLRHLERISEQLHAGTVTTDQVRILLRGYRPSTAAEFVSDQETLLEAARTVHVDDLSRVVDVWVAHIDPDGPAPDDHRDQEVHLHQVLDGPFALHGQLAAPNGQTLDRALERAMADLRPSQHADGEPMTPAQRRAEALVELARHYLAIDHQANNDTTSPTTTSPTSPTSPVPRHQPRITVLTNPTDLALGLGARCTDGTWLSGDDVRRFLCDATLQAALTDATGNLLRSYASGRFPTATLRASVYGRDRRCRFHGCDRPAATCDIHHLVRVADGGRTEPDNLVTLCGRHHTLLHHGWTARLLPDGHLCIRRPCGTVLPEPPRRVHDPPDTG